MMYKQGPVAIGGFKKKMACLLVVAPAPLKEQRCGDQLKSVSLAAVEQEKQQVCVLLNSSTTLCDRIQSYSIPDPITFSYGFGSDLRIRQCELGTDPGGQ
jgi:hypothetical protein